MRATRKSARPTGELVELMNAGAELRVDPNRERAFLRLDTDDADVAAIVTWPEAAELGRLVPQSIVGLWHGFLCFRARSTLCLGGLGRGAA